MVASDGAATPAAAGAGAAAARAPAPRPPPPAWHEAWHNRRQWASSGAQARQTAHMQ